MDLLKQFGPLLSSVAPSIATALGGPLAGLAVKSLSKALLGAEDFSEEAVMDAMATASPEQLAAVKKIDADFKVQMKSLDIDLERIAVDDRKSARTMQTETKDWIPRALAISVTLGYFGIIAYVLISGLPMNGSEVLLMLLGTLSAGWTGVMAFYFGSSSGSQKKDAMIHNSIPRDEK
ncbi:hypothetical protein UFOVP1459_25 [uncultured Caudovirales phage]|uniref:Holin of 3TMs, for gene-transfer release n=1 Tax=uncultured Caudovirales phage TaxID=2100421 RepID=A0A6J5STR8_9CAUD|nr:hypothetical protein UFOVP1459_25 [uncultured Caudovirales phage]CAB4218962.1 hypothetical protein UFOVP1609_57 [uncultured Caudovirales phage]